jgi:hypothetical protein
MRLFCGSLLEKSPPFTAELVENSNIFGANNLYCRWNAINPDSNRVITLNFTKFISNLGDQYAIEILYNDGTTIYHSLDTKSYLFSDKGVQNILFHYFSPRPKSALPFQITFDNNIIYSQSYIGLFISIGVILFFCIICSFVFYKCSKLIIDNSNRRFRERLNNNIRPIQHLPVILDNDVEDSQELELKKENLNKLNSLFENELRPSVYFYKLNEYDGNCSICLEEFKNSVLVIKLFCKHIFHSKCLKNWCDKTILSPKCPNCLLNIIPKESPDEMVGENANANALVSNQNATEENQVLNINNNNNILPQAQNEVPELQENADLAPINNGDSNRNNPASNDRLMFQNRNHVAGNDNNMTINNLTHLNIVTNNENVVQEEIGSEDRENSLIIQNNLT